MHLPDCLAEVKVNVQLPESIKLKEYFLGENNFRPSKNVFQACVFHNFPQCESDDMIHVNFTCYVVSGLKFIQVCILITVISVVTIHCSDTCNVMYVYFMS